VTAVLAACLLVLLALGLAERAARDRAWRDVPIRVHVNGSRGKSTVTRLVWSALRTAGVPALAKTTGTRPRLLLPDGSEHALVRRAPASIREQLALLRRARRLGAKAVVVECMALDPELQWVSERRMVAASLGIITNVRPDHEEMMGADLDSIASSLANTIPRRAVLVIGESRHAALFEARAEGLGTRVVGVPPSSPADGAEGAPPPIPRWLAEDRAIALAATRQLGIDDETARRGFDKAPPDPGAASSGTLEWRDRRVHWLDATAANDPDSLGRLLGPMQIQERAPYLALVYNHRADRGPRLATFTRHADALATADTLIVTGARPPWTVWRALRRARASRETAFLRRRALAGRLRRLPSEAQVVFCGNTRGFDLPFLLREVSADG
jgi:poly-gamma-glutamate synthase PgsB/CapB